MDNTSKIRRQNEFWQWFSMVSVLTSALTIAILAVALPGWDWWWAIFIPAVIVNSAIVVYTQIVFRRYLQALGLSEADINKIMVP